MARRGRPFASGFNQSPLIRLASSSSKIAIAALVVVSEIFRPLYRPLVFWLSSLALFERLSAIVAGSPRGLVLVLLVVPFAIAEPLKWYALLLLAQHHLASGLGLTIVAHLISFVIVERIFEAGRPQLLTYSSLAWIIGRMDVVLAAVAKVRLSLGLYFWNWLRKAR